MIEEGETAIVVAIVVGPPEGAIEAEVGVAVATDGVTEGRPGPGPARALSRAIDARVIDARAHAHRVAGTAAVTDTGEIRDGIATIEMDSDLGAAGEGVAEATAEVARAPTTLITSRMRRMDAPARRTIVAVQRPDSRKTTKMPLTGKAIASRMAVTRQLLTTRITRIEAWMSLRATMTGMLVQPVTT